MNAIFPAIPKIIRPYYTMRLVCVLLRFVIENARKREKNATGSRY